MHCAIYISASRAAKFGVAVFKASMFMGGRSTIRCAKFGVVVFKASMLNCRGSMCHGHIYIVL